MRREYQEIVRRTSEQFNAVLRSAGVPVRVDDRFKMSRDYSRLTSGQVLDLATNHFLPREDRIAAMQAVIQGNPTDISHSTIASKREEWIRRGASLFGNQEDREAAREVLGMLRRVASPAETASQSDDIEPENRDPVISQLREQWEKVLSNKFSNPRQIQNAQDALQFLSEQERKS